MTHTLNDVVFDKLSDRLDRTNLNQDIISGLLFDGEETSEGLIRDQVFRLSSLEDAKNMGIHDEYDVNGQSAYYQIQQYFRLNPLGDLFIMATNGTSYKEVVAKAKKMQEVSGGEIRQMAIIFSGTTSFEVTKTAIQEAQVQVDIAYQDYMPFEVLVEGKGFANVLSTGVSAIEDLGDLESNNVSVVVAMDVDAAIRYPNSASVGMMLGAISRSKVSENIAWVGEFDLMGIGFIKAGFVGGEEAKTKINLETLHQKRYVFARNRIGLPGLYFNDSHTATIGTSDFGYVENNRTKNKAVRLLYTTLLKNINRSILVNGTEELTPSVQRKLEELCVKALKVMVTNKEVSAFDIFIDPTQNIRTTCKLRVKAEITPIGTTRKMIIDLAIKEPYELNT